MPIRDWVAANKFYLTPVLFLAGLGTVLWAFQFQPAPASAVSTATRDAHYVGRVDLQRSRGGILHAGYGIGWRSSSPGPTFFPGVRPETYVRFSYALNLTEDDIARVRASGPPYEIGMHEGVVVTIAGGQGSVISYEEYSARATKRRDQLLALGIGLLILALWTFFVRGEAPRDNAK